ncbi:MAG: glycosyltransferase [Synergistaceae bacterium]|jgi:glycosyltransferase involved in cell wall biosynthesis|nr:glycosyltransferase [Synergistaceae bacterium]
MADLYIYGAGNRTRYFLPLLKERFNVLAIFDNDPEKHGQEICGVRVGPIISDSQISVCICITDVESALESIKPCKFPDILFLMGYEQHGYGVIFRCLPACAPIDAIFDCEPVGVLFSGSWDIEKAPIEETAQIFDKTKPRVFNLALFPDEGQLGGSMAIHKIIRDVNMTLAEEGGISNLFSVNTTRIAVPDAAAAAPMALPVARETDGTGGEPPTVKNPPPGFNSLCGGLPLYNRITSFWCRLLLAEHILKKASRLFGFRNEDVFLLSEVRDAYAFARIFPGFEKVFIGYHEQGSLASVMDARGNIREFYDSVQHRVLNTFKNWIFPSTGAYEGFHDTASELTRRELSMIRRHICYNGFTPRDVDRKGAGGLLDLIRAKRNEQRLVFVSATYLYKNKGVERIPGVLAHIRETYKRHIYWILIGDGEKHDEVRQAIERHLHNDEYVWQTERLARQEALFAVFNDADFYIMTHHVSVFDLSILQGMAYGCVPVLSGVGGNKEFCGYENGVLYDEAFFLGEAFQPANDRVFTDSAYLETMKEKNTGIIRSGFSDENFIRRYARTFETAKGTVWDSNTATP